MNIYILKSMYKLYKNLYLDIYFKMAWKNKIVASKFPGCFVKYCSTLDITTDHFQVILKKSYIK